MSTQEFFPTWASPPGATIADILSARGILPGDFCKNIGLEETKYSQLISGELPLLDKMASSLASYFGTSEAFWKNREIHYRADLEREVLSKEALNLTNWLKAL